jgi:hypothetical protein
VALAKKARKDDTEVEQVWKEQDHLLQTMARLYAEHDSTQQEWDDARGWVSNLLGKVEKERDLKLKAEGVSTGLAMEVDRGKVSIHTLETKVSW